MSKIYRFAVYLASFAIIIVYINLIVAYSKDFSSVAEQVMPSVCQVLGTPKSEDKPTEQNPLQNFLNKQPPKDIPHMIVGTCFVVKHNDKKIIITNNHVIENLENIKIAFESSLQSYHVIVSRANKKSDIAVLEYVDSSDDFTDIPALEWGDSTQLQHGDPVMAIGHPLGKSFTVSTGIVSHPGRYNDPGYGSVIQTDTAINKGNSGGPLFNDRGRVVGINSFIISSNGGGQIGINFSISSATAKNMVAQLYEYGEVRKPFYGMRYMLDFAQGAYVILSVMEDGPAEAAGIQSGDQLYAINGVKIVKEADISLLNQVVGGEPSMLSVLRDNKIVDVKVITEIF